MKKALFAIPLAALALTACGEGGKDAGVQKRSYGDRPVYNMPDEFSNLSAICIKGVLVIETTRRDNAPSSMVTVSGDPSCTGLDGVPPRNVAN